MEEASGIADTVRGDLHSGLSDDLMFSDDRLEGRLRSLTAAPV